MATNEMSRFVVLAAFFLLGTEVRPWNYSRLLCEHVCSAFLSKQWLVPGCLFPACSNCWALVAVVPCIISGHSVTRRFLCQVCMYAILLLLTLGNGRSASRIGRFTHRERISLTFWIGGWIGPISGVKTIPWPCQDLNPGHPALHYTDWAITAHF